MGSLIFGSTTIQGRTFDDIQIQTSKAGVPRQIIFGRVLPVVGNIIATTEPKIVKKKEKQKSGKGGGSTTVVNEEIYRTYAIRICEGPITGIRRVWRNNELVYHRDSSDATQLINNRAFLQLAEFFLGDWEQMPSAVMQAAFGIDNVPAHRGTCYLVIDNENLTSTGGAIPQYAFEVERQEGRVVTSRPYALEAVDALGSEFADVRPAPGASISDGISSQLVQLSGELRTILGSYDQYAPETIGSDFVGVSGELRTVLGSYNHYAPEAIESTFIGVSGALQAALIIYNDHTAESITSEFVSITGELTG
ncbi:hypothetical protein MO867_21905 [Microbulbifer sp. OS29]|uniref:Uncharacterized protein n=1 Tax=Microbulbifer okhotskensis TaxID=2926617 RepID=A0A9X2EW05_9GAMM|nr:hypothetical protein [Microbulbifer okhotskensis]MCO1336983.1 hypothetical protein [Microbulbifer okhotskensis]